jgi:hypothetical protein
MRQPSLSLLLVLLWITVTAASEIREFSLPTLERLGNELYRRDFLALKASSAVFKTQPAARAMKGRGSVTRPEGKGGTVYFTVATPSGPRLSYIVTLSTNKDPEVQDVRGQSIPPKIAVRDTARQTASIAMKSKAFNLAYDFEVLDDPEGDGFLVYALGSGPKEGDVALAGNLRVTVSADGKRATRVDALSRSVMIENKYENHSPKGYHDVAAFMTQLVSNKPVETLVLANRQLERDIFVGTPDGRVWLIHDGKITENKARPGDKTAAGAVKQTLKQ